MLEEIIQQIKNRDIGIKYMKYDLENFEISFALDCCTIDDSFAIAEYIVQMIDVFRPITSNGKTICVSDLQTEVHHNGELKSVIIVKPRDEDY